MPPVERALARSLARAFPARLLDGSPRARSPSLAGAARSLASLSIVGILLAAAAAAAGCLGLPQLASGAECPSPVAPEGAGFVRHAYYVRAEGAPVGGARFVVPIPVTEEGEPAPVIDCLALHDGEASWRVVDEGGARFLEVETSSERAVVRASLLFGEYSNATLARTNWSLAPLDRELAGAPPPPSGSKNAYPIGSTRAYAGASDVVLTVYYAVDAGQSDDGDRVVHREDVFERKTIAGWQEPVVFRSYRVLD